MNQIRATTYNVVARGPCLVCNAPEIRDLRFTYMGPNYSDELMCTECAERIQQQQSEDAKTP